MKAGGITLAKLKIILRPYVRLPDSDFDALCDKIDHKHETKIMWKEFMDFLRDEGERRALANSQMVQRFQSGSTIIKPGIRTKIKRKNNKYVDFTIQQLTIINFDETHLQAFVVFDKTREAAIFNLKTFQISKMLEFSKWAGYVEPQPKTPREHKNSRVRGKMGRESSAGA